MTPSLHPTAQNAAAAQKQTCCCSEADLPLCRVAKCVEVLPAGVLDHGGRPAQEHEGIVPWRRQVRVGVKAVGLGLGLGSGLGLGYRVRAGLGLGLGLGVTVGLGLGFVFTWSGGCYLAQVRAVARRIGWHSGG